MAKKSSLILHSIFGMLTMFFYFIGDSFYYFLIASITYGIAGAFITGTRNAFLYDTLKELKQENDFKKYNGRVLLYSHLVNAVVLLFIPVIYIFNVKLPFLIGIGFFLISLIIALFMIESPISKKTKQSLSIYHTKILDSIREIRVSKKVVFLLALAMITSAFVWMSTNFFQPLLLISGLEIVYFGIIYALMRAIMGISGEVTHRLGERLPFRSLMFLGFIFMILGLLGFFIGSGIIIILAVLLLKFSEGFNRITLEDEINKNIISENRMNYPPTYVTSL